MIELMRPYPIVSMHQVVADLPAPTDIPLTAAIPS